MNAYKITYTDPDDGGRQMLAVIVTTCPVDLFAAVEHCNAHSDELNELAEEREQHLFHVWVDTIAKAVGGQVLAFDDDVNLQRYLY